MIIFDQLRLSDDGSQMFIDVHVNKAEYFKDIYLDSITIIPADKVSETYPDIPNSNYLYQKTFEGNLKQVSMRLTASDFLKRWGSEASKIAFPESEMYTTLFFVYIKCKGTVGACTPCRLDELITLGVTFDEKLLYQRVMDYTKMFADDCTIPTGFIDFILLWNAFKSAIETEHYIPAIKYWKLLFGLDTGIGNINYKGCGCHG